MFRTEIPFIPQPRQLPPSARVLTVGSCFAETMGSRLVDYKVDALVNPFGTIFNPLAACQLLRAAAGEEVDWQQHLVEARGRWQSYDLHATIGAESPVALLQRIQELVGSTGEFLRTADAVVLTLGTAWVYRLLETGELVNNCHKVPAEKFAKELLTPDEIVNAVAETHAYLRRSQPDLRFILTVSPVRHLKDTLVLNSVSKSALRVACHYLSELLPDVSYFPAYELLLDDLRDYRFYAEDMLHPSKAAEDYIWERFTRTYFNADFGRFKQEWSALRQALAHRPLYAAAPEHRQFLEGIVARLQQVGAQIDVQTEMADVRQRLATLPVPVVIEPLPEPDDDEERIDIGDEAAPVVEALLAEAAVESPAISANETVVEASSDEEEIIVLAEDDMARPAPKKKRRSRGGAKRTARKRAALAAQETEETTATPVTAEPSATKPTAAPDEVTAMPDAPSPTPTATSGEPDAPAEAIAAEPAETAEIPTSTLDKSRRGRSAGQILADQKKRRGGRKSGAAVAPAITTGTPAAAAPIAAPVVTETTSRESAAEPVVTQTAAPTLSAPEPTLVKEVAPTPVEPAFELPKPAAPAAPAAKPNAADTPAPIAAKPKTARPARKKPVAKTAADQEVSTAAVETPLTPLVEAPAADEPKAPIARPARKKPATKAAPKKPAATASKTPAAPEGTGAAKAPPKRRPARKKPAPTDETPSAS